MYTYIYIYIHIYAPCSQALHRKFKDHPSYLKPEGAGGGKEGGRGPKERRGGSSGEAPLDARFQFTIRHFAAEVYMKIVMCVSISMSVSMSISISIYGGSSGEAPLDARFQFTIRHFAAEVRTMFTHTHTYIHMCIYLSTYIYTYIYIYIYKDITIDR